MKTRKYQIVRLFGRFSKTEINVEVLEDVEHGNLSSAIKACEVAKALYGGNWAVMLETEKTVTVWVDEEKYNNWKSWYNRETKKTRKARKG